jgi:hypothetical protein
MRMVRGSFSGLVLNGNGEQVVPVPVHCLIVVQKPNYSNFPPKRSFSGLHSRARPVQVVTKAPEVLASRAYQIGTSIESSLPTSPEFDERNAR